MNNRVCTNRIYYIYLCYSLVQSLNVRHLCRWSLIRFWKPTCRPVFEESMCIVPGVISSCMLLLSSFFFCYSLSSKCNAVPFLYYHMDNFVYYFILTGDVNYTTDCCSIFTNTMGIIRLHFIQKIKKSFKYRSQRFTNLNIIREFRNI